MSSLEARIRVPALHEEHGKIGQAYARQWMELQADGHRLICHESHRLRWRATNDEVGAAGAHRLRRAANLRRNRCDPRPMSALLRSCLRRGANPRGRQSGSISSMRSATAKGRLIPPSPLAVPGSAVFAG